MNPLSSFKHRLNLKFRGEHYVETLKFNFNPGNGNILLEES